MSTNTYNIPNTLKKIPHWVNWKLTENKNGKPNKVPVDAKTQRYAKTNDPSTWCDFETAKHNNLNLGFVLTDTDFIGIDIDYPFDSTICKEIIEHFDNTYYEISPSGNLRIMCLGKIPRAGKSNLDKAIEVYDKTSPRYLTITGNLIKSTMQDIEDCQEAIDWLYEKYFQNSPTTPIFNKKDYELSDEDILQKCRRASNASKFETLWAGSGNDDESSGDMALTGIIAFYTKNATQIDRLIRQSNRKNIHNGKWDKKHSSSGATYGQITIEKVVKNADSHNSKWDKQHSSSENTYREITIVEAVKNAEWYNKLSYHKNERTGETTIINNLNNLVIITENNENLKDLFSFNEFTGKIKITRDSKEIGLKANKELEDNDITEIRYFIGNSLRHNFNSHAVNWGANDVLSAIIRNAKRHFNYHPIRDYLNTLEWDKENRISYFFSDHCGTTQNEYNKFIAHSFFISAVARIFEPGCKVDTMIILEGTQGIGKSSLFRTLCKNEEWFRDSNIDLDSKDAYTGLHGKWIIEMSELDALNKTETTRIKSFITSQNDSYRPPYGKCDIDVPRQCIFVGTTNKSNYLKDETGNRRFLPIKCKYVDIKNITASAPQLWAEAVYRYHNNEKWYVERENITLNKAITEQQEERYESDVWEDTIKNWAEDLEEFTISRVATDVLFFKIADINRGIEMRISKILVSLGYRRVQKRENGKRHYVYTK